MSVHTPSDERINVSVDATRLWGPRYVALVNQLQEMLGEIDDEYSEKAIRGRSLKARHRRLTYGKKVNQHLPLKFSPFPSRYTNIISSLRRSVYTTVNEHCLILQSMQTGNFRRNTYLLPFPEAPQFMAEIDKMNKEVIDDLNEKIVNFKNTQNFSKVKGMLEGAGLFAGRFSDNHHINRVTVDLTPLRVDPKIVEDIVEDKYKKTFKKIDAEEKRGLELLQRELEQKRRELVTRTIDNLRQQIDSITKRLIGEKKLKAPKNHLLRLRKLCDDVGLSAFSSDVIDPLIEVCDAPPEQVEDVALKVLGTVDVSKGTNDRINSLLEAL